MEISIVEEGEPAVRRRIVESLIARLPEWFARCESNRHYAGLAERLEAWVARLHGQISLRHDAPS
jgi:hypothetical protein